MHDPGFHILLSSFHRILSMDHLVQHNKQYHRKELLNSFDLNFTCALEENLQPPRIAWQTFLIRKKLLIDNNFYLNIHTLGFHPQNQKLEPYCTA